MKISNCLLSSYIFHGIYQKKKKKKMYIYIYIFHGIAGECVSTEPCSLSCSNIQYDYTIMFNIISTYFVNLNAYFCSKT